MVEKKVGSLKAKLFTKKCEIDLLAIERDLLRARMEEEKKRTQDIILGQKEDDDIEKRPIRINGVSNRAGSYNSVMYHIAQSSLMPRSQSHGSL